MKKINRKYLFDTEVGRIAFDREENKEYFLDRELSIKTFDNATVIPASFHSWEENPVVSEGGLFDESGSYIEESSVFHWNLILFNKVVSEKVLKSAEYCDETVFYGGLFVEHWGHFIVDSMTHLWPFALYPEKYKDVKVIFLTLYDTKEIEGPYLEFLDLLGIKKNQIILVQKPLQYKKIIVPESCMSINNFYTKEYKFFIDYVISQAMAQHVQIKTHKKIYMSRKNWALSYDRDIAEDKIERFFNQNGFKSVSMEQYSFVEQVHILQNAENLACAICTLAHNLLFAKDGVQAAIINKTLNYNITQFMIDDVKKLDVTYIDAFFAMIPVGFGAGPFLFDMNEHLENYAKDNNMKFSRAKMKKTDLIKYFDACFRKVDDIPDSRLRYFKEQYQMMHSRCSFYSPKELLIKKYFYKVLSMFINGKNKYFYNKYIEYKNRLKEYKKVMF